MKIIGLIGKLQSGKTTASNFILDYYDAIKLSFGDPVKEMILNAGLCNIEELWGVKTPFSRLMLQKIGTDIIRKQVDNNFWINKSKEKILKIKNENSNSLIVFDDVRFINEAELIKTFDNILIRITRPNIERNNIEDKHDSEIEQDLINVNYEIINDGDLEQLRNKIINVIKNIENG